MDFLALGGTARLVINTGGFLFEKPSPVTADNHANTNLDVKDGLQGPMPDSSTNLLKVLANS